MLFSTGISKLPSCVLPTQVPRLRPQGLGYRVPCVARRLENYHAAGAASIRILYPRRTAATPSIARKKHAAPESRERRFRGRVLAALLAGWIVEDVAVPQDEPPYRVPV